MSVVQHILCAEVFFAFFLLLCRPALKGIHLKLFQALSSSFGDACDQNLGMYFSRGDVSEISGLQFGQLM